MRAPCLRGPKPSSRVVLVLLCWSPTMKRRDRRDLISATAFINAFNELDVPCSSGAVSGRFRAGCAARVLVGSVLVTCRCLAVVRVSAPPARGLLWGFFGGFRSRCAPPLRPGCLFGWCRRSRARCGKAEVPRFYLTKNVRADLGHTTPTPCRIGKRPPAPENRPAIEESRGGGCAR